MNVLTHLQAFESLLLHSVSHPRFVSDALACLFSDKTRLAKSTHTLPDSSSVCVKHERFF